MRYLRYALLGLLALGVALLSGGGHLAAANPGGQVLVGINGGRLATVDPSTGAVTIVGPIGFETACCLAVDPSDLLFGLHDDPDKAAPQLITIDPSTGVGTPVVDVSDLSEIGWGLAFDSSGTLFSVGHDLLTLNPLTGAVTVVGPIGLAATAHISAIAFAPSGVLFAVTFDPGSGPPDNIPGGPPSLIMIDPVTGAGTSVGALDPEVEVTAIAFDASGVLFGATCGLDDKLVTIDLLTAQLTIVGSLEGLLSPCLQGLSFRTSAADSDGDGFPDSVDGCPSTPTVWPTPIGDGDCDGWTTSLENIIGTDPNDNCGGDLTWPPNMFDSAPSTNIVDIFDVNRLAPPVFFSTPGPGSFYDVRFDLTGGTFPGDPIIDIFDVNKMAPPVFFATCTP